MKVTVTTRSEEQFQECACRGALLIEIDGKKVFEASDGEPEDNNLVRNFSDVYEIPTLMERCFQAGKNGEDFKVFHASSDDL